jgi:hypothetical protein
VSDADAIVAIKAAQAVLDQSYNGLALAQEHLDVALAALQPASPPPSGVRVGIISNIAGWPAREEPRMLALGAKLTREDTADAIPWCKANGIDVIQIIPAGAAVSASGDAYAFEVGGNEPYWHGVDPAAWAAQTLTDVKGLRAAHPGVKILVPLVSRGIPGGGNGDGSYTYNGVTKPWVEWVEPSGLLAAADGFAVHPYFNSPPFHVLDTVRAQLTAHGHAQPFWITEVGMYLGTQGEVGPKDGPAQAADFAAILAAAKARTDVAACVLYRLSENSEGTESWGILNPDGTPRPAYAVVKAALA